MTFSVHGTDLNRKPLPVAKGSIEVLNVVGAHVSQARITGIKDRARDPILQQDVLYNPTWDPHLKKHVAITGIVDLTGDGRDSQQEFIRNLERQGIVVDAYVDLRALNEDPLDMAKAIKGRGIGVQTDFLIIGDGTEYLSDSPANLRFRRNLDEVVKAMNGTAKQNGVTVVGLRRYLEMIGYRVPRVSDRTTTYRPTLPLADQPKEQPKDPMNPMPMEQPKDAPEGSAKDPGRRHRTRTWGCECLPPLSPVLGGEGLGVRGFGTWGRHSCLPAGRLESRPTSPSPPTPFCVNLRFGCLGGALYSFGMKPDVPLPELDDWQLVCQLLPPGWQEQARLLGALRRARGFANAAVLLRTLLVHLAAGCSLKETATSVHQPVGVMSRRWPCSRLRRRAVAALAGRPALAASSNPLVAPRLPCPRRRCHHRRQARQRWHRLACPLQRQLGGFAVRLLRGYGHPRG